MADLLNGEGEFYHYPTIKGVRGGGWQKAISLKKSCLISLNPLFLKNMANAESFHHSVFVFFFKLTVGVMNQWVSQPIWYTCKPVYINTFLSKLLCLCLCIRHH